jgi:hypothetical protein
VRISASSRRSWTARSGSASSLLATPSGREFLDNGFHNFGETTLGPAIILARYPDRSLEELRHHVWWVWDADKMMANIFPALGIKIIKLPINEAVSAYEADRVDGFTTTASAALAPRLLCHACAPPRRNSASRDGLKRQEEERSHPTQLIDITEQTVASQRRVSFSST